VHASDGKFVEVVNWTTTAEKTVAFHTDFQAELKED
jgi:hypothetical protein